MRHQATNLIFARGILERWHATVATPANLSEDGIAATVAAVDHRREFRVAHGCEPGAYGLPIYVDSTKAAKSDAATEPRSRQPQKSRPAAKAAAFQVRR
jgi:hypothetical protein